MTDDYGNTVAAPLAKAQAVPQPAALPVEVLKNKRVINLYYVAVVALALVVTTRSRTKIDRSSGQGRWRRCYLLHRAVV